VRLQLLRDRHPTPRDNLRCGKCKLSSCFLCPKLTSRSAISLVLECLHVPAAAH
jgi:hypothetical protein